MFTEATLRNSQGVMGGCGRKLAWHVHMAWVRAPPLAKKPREKLHHGQ